MTSSVPPHYLAFRITLVVVLLAALAAVTWFVARPALLGPILYFLKAR
jgi:hypothetical protein